MPIKSYAAVVKRYVANPLIAVTAALLGSMLVVSVIAIGIFDPPQTEVPPPPPPTTVYVETPGPTKTVVVETPGPIKTIEVTREPRASREYARKNVDSPFTGWKDRYWQEGQNWSQQPKTKAVIMCESTNRVKAVSATGKYRGLYQMDKDAWASYGGLELAARPDLATRQEQNYVAYRLYSSRGWQPWSCA